RPPRRRLGLLPFQCRTPGSGRIAALGSPARQHRRSPAAPGRRTPAGGAGHARGRPELGRFRRRRHGAALLARPHLGSPGPRRAAAAGTRRRTRCRLRRRCAGGTAGAAFAPLRLRRLQRPGGGGGTRAAQPPGTGAGAGGRHACPGPARGQFRPGAADARAHLCRAPGRGGGRGGADAAPRRPAGGRLPEQARAPRRRHALWPRQPGLQPARAAPLRRQGRPGGAGLRAGDPGKAPAPLRTGQPAGAQAVSVLPWKDPARAEALLRALGERILVLDGAMGTMIQRHGLDEAGYRGQRFAAGYDDLRFSDGHTHGPGCGCEARDLKGNNDLLSLSRPELIAGIHRAYLEAGADIIETNTFNGTAVSQADYRLEHLVPELNREAARLARLACDAAEAADPARPRFVAGVLGPTSRTASISPKVEDPGYRNIRFDELVDNYAEAAQALVEGGADILLVETVFDTLNAKAALYALEKLFERLGVRLPVMVSGTITDRSGRTLSGQTAEAFWYSVRHARPLAIGLNCALGARDLRAHVDVLARVADTHVSCHPNAGLPNAFGGYDEGPEDM